MAGPVLGGRPFFYFIFMDTRLIKLFKKDQENILLFKQGKRGQDEFQRTYDEISDKFFLYVSEHGFPYKGTCSYDAYRAGVALALHLSGEKLEVIFPCLESVVNTKIEPSDRAYLIDRIRVLKGKAQLYGTQFKRDDDGRVTLIDIEDAESVDVRRNAMGLEPLASYLNRIRS